MIVVFIRSILQALRRRWLKQNCIVELQVLAVSEAIKKFRIYLSGILSFKIVTDCQTFTLTLKKADCCAKVAK